MRALPVALGATLSIAFVLAPGAGPAAGIGVHSSLDQPWTVTRASITQSGSFVTGEGALSRDGKLVAFVHRQCPGGAKPCTKALLVRNVGAGSTRTVSYSGHVRGLGHMRPDIAQPALSTNGRWLTVDESYTRTLWLTDRKKGSWRGLRETTAGPIYRAAFSANGRYLLFRAAKCAPSRGGFGIGRYDLRSHSIRCAHPSAKLKPVDNFESNDLRISGDGRFAVFLARPPKSTRRDSTSREYLYDFQAATMVEVVPGGSAHASTDGTPGISDDGRLVLVQGSADHSDDALYVRDRQAGTTTRADSFPAPAGYVESFHPSISGDGTAVAYRGRPANGAAGIYVRSPLDGPATRVAAVGTASGSSDGTAETAELSTDGRSLLFSDARGRLQIATR